MTDRFDAAYFRRHYLNPRTAAVTRAEATDEAQFIGYFVKLMGIPVRRILDAGCGTGWMRAPLLRHFPRAKYTGIDVSSYLCKRYGWKQSSIQHFEAKPFDLVLCHDVLQYLDEPEAERAIVRLRKLSAAVLSFRALTQQDWEYRCDQKRTDGDVFVRAGDWYRERLSPRFEFIGGGMHVRRGTGTCLFELEWRG